jgi:hypothetical protein
MEDDFDVDAAVDEIGGDLGLAESKADSSEDLELEVDLPDDKEAPAEPTVEAATEPAAEVTPSETIDPANEAPKTWRKEAAAAWATLPSEIKNEVLKREADMFKGIEQYKEAATYANTFRSAISEYEPILKANNMDPIKTAAGLFAAHHALATSSPERKVELLHHLAKDYGIDLAEAAIYTPPYMDPAVEALQKQLELVQSRLAESDRQAQTASQANISKEVDAFAAKNLYFDEVADTVATLLSTKAADTLQDAYDKAIWMNPTTRAKEIARQTAEAAAKVQTRVQVVKQATAANVKTRGKSGSTAAPSGTLDDTLTSSLAEIRSRA